MLLHDATQQLQCSYSNINHWEQACTLYNLLNPATDSALMPAYFSRHFKMSSSLNEYLLPSPKRSHISFVGKSPLAPFPFPPPLPPLPDTQG
jgi:hypothetical protein